MLIRTHLASTVLLILVFISYFENKLSFVLTALFATFLPDIDSRFSKLGKRKIFRILQWFSGHRKIFHSFLFLGLISFPLFFISKNIFYGFILGYGLHLILDTFTVQGIKPFYPFEFRVKGIFKTGGILETIFFYCLVLLICFWIFRIIF